MPKRFIQSRTIGLLASALLLVATLPETSARMEVVQLRKTRQTKADERWSEPERVTINVHYRVPVIETLGFLAAFYPDDTKLVAISKRLRPIATQVNELAGESFQGRVFPPEVREQCNALRAELFKAVDEVYGPAASQRIETYIEQKYKTLTTGLFSTIEG